MADLVAEAVVTDDPQQGTTHGAGNGFPPDMTVSQMLYESEKIAYAQVTRERVDNLALRVGAIDAKINAIVVGIVVQLLGFVIAVFMAVFNHIFIVTTAGH